MARVVKKELGGNEFSVVDRKSGMFVLTECFVLGRCGQREREKPIVGNGPVTDSNEMQ